VRVLTRGRAVGRHVRATGVWRRGGRGDYERLSREVVDELSPTPPLPHARESRAWSCGAPKLLGELGGAQRELVGQVLANGGFRPQLCAIQRYALVGVATSSAIAVGTGLR
jgi:hypothetical protein